MESDSQGDYTGAAEKNQSTFSERFPERYPELSQNGRWLL
jgi:hypothetical protein